MAAIHRFVAAARATAAEILSEPLSLLLLLAAMAIATLAPAFHYHQFGEASRMARDAGFSAHFLCGSLFAVFGILRSLRREIESGTLQMALAHPISRGGFFLSKVSGALVAQAVFAILISAVALTMVRGAEIGGLVAKKTGDVARLWGPSLAVGVGDIVLPLVIGAALNRFARARFVRSAFLSALVLAPCGAIYQFDAALAGRLLPLCVLMFLLTLVYLAASAAFAVRFRANVASACVGLVVLASVPFVGNYYLTDALAKGGAVAWSYVGWATLATLPALVAFLLLGVRFAVERDS